MGRPPQTGAVQGVPALPTVNAVLNRTSAVLLTAGYCLIRQWKVTAHLTCMLMRRTTLHTFRDTGRRSIMPPARAAVSPS